MTSVVVIVLSLITVQTMGIGDAPIHEGRLSRSAEGFEYRACDKDETYLVDASFLIHETLDRFLQSRSTVKETSVYVRFHGEFIEELDGLPDRFAEVVLITELLSYSVTVPVRCK